MARLVLAAALAVSLPLATPAQVSPPGLDRGLVASYPFDGDAVDVVTRARALAEWTRPGDGHDGRRGGALVFDGARAQVNLGDRLEPARFTIAAWIRPDGVDRPQAIVSKVRNLPGHWARNFELRLDPGGRLYLQVPGGAGWDGVAGARALAPGRWAHVAAVYDGIRAQLFVDGVRDGAPLEVRYAQTHTEIFVGARPEGGGRDGRVASGPTFHFGGAIEDVRIWDRPLSDAELSAVLAGRFVPAPEPPPVASRPGAVELIARYPLDGDARDAVGRADGTLVGGRPAEDRRGDPRGALALGGRDWIDLGVRGAPERFTIAAWVRPNRVARDAVVLSKWAGAPGGREGWLELRVEAGGRLALALPGGLRGQGIRSRRALAAGRWTHVAASFDGDRAAVYVDGQLDAEANLSPFDAARGRVFLGARPEGSGDRARPGTGFDGRLDDVRIWRGAAADAEIALAARDGGGGRGGDDDGGDPLLVKVDRMVVRYDATCARRDAGALARVEAAIASELGDAEAAARRDRGGNATAQRLRRAADALGALRGRTDAMSLDRKRTALFELSDALWNDLAQDLDDDRQDDRRDGRREGGRDGTWF